TVLVFRCKFLYCCFFLQAEDGIRDRNVTGVQTCALPICEYVENTIKNILTIPVSRVSFIMSKTLLLFMWIMMLTMIAWFLTLFLGLLTQFDGLDISLLVESFKEFSIGGV